MNPRTRRSALVAMAALGLVAVAACGGTDDAPPAEVSSDGGASESAEARPEDFLRLNELQVIGTHNSFHVAAPEEEFALLEQLNPAEAAKRTYSHPPLDTQLGDQHVRQIELDVFADAEGGRYADPQLRRRANLGPWPDEVPAMSEPGTKVLHEQDVDYHSNCPTLVECLTLVKDFSAAHPDHVPIAVHLQFKDGPLIFNVPGQAVPEQWTPVAMAAMEAEIASVFDSDAILTPDDVRGDAETLEAAVLADGWPTLGASRGKVMFLMINPEPYRSIYLEAHPDLDGALLFTNAEPGQPDASYVGVDDPIEDADRIADLVGQGYLVRSRADEPNVQARTGDTTTRDAALASGAHWISTDYPAPVSQAGIDPDYVVTLPGAAAARCNPVTAPADCEDSTIEG